MSREYTAVPAIPEPPQLTFDQASKLTEISDLLELKKQKLTKLVETNEATKKDIISLQKSVDSLKSEINVIHNQIIANPTIEQTEALVTLLKKQVSDRKPIQTDNKLDLSSLLPASKDGIQSKASKLLEERMLKLGVGKSANNFDDVLIKECIGMLSNIKDQHRIDGVYGTDVLTFLESLKKRELVSYQSNGFSQSSDLHSRQSSSIDMKANIHPAVPQRAFDSTSTSFDIAPRSSNERAPERSFGSTLPQSTDAPQLFDSTISSQLSDLPRTSAPVNTFSAKYVAQSNDSPSTSSFNHGTSSHSKTIDSSISVNSPFQTSLNDQYSNSSKFSSKFTPSTSNVHHHHHPPPTNQGDDSSDDDGPIESFIPAVKQPSEDDISKRFPALNEDFYKPSVQGRDSTGLNQPGAIFNSLNPQTKPLQNDQSTAPTFSAFQAARQSISEKIVEVTPTIHRSVSFTNQPKVNERNSISETSNSTFQKRFDLTAKSSTEKPFNSTFASARMAVQRSLDTQSATRVDVTISEPINERKQESTNSSFAAARMAVQRSLDTQSATPVNLTVSEPIIERKQESTNSSFAAARMALQQNLSGTFTRTEQQENVPVSSKPDLPPPPPPPISILKSNSNVTPPDLNDLLSSIRSSGMSSLKKTAEVINTPTKPLVIKPLAKSSTIHQFSKVAKIIPNQPSIDVQKIPHPLEVKDVNSKQAAQLKNKEPANSQVIFVSPFYSADSWVVVENEDPVLYTAEAIYDFPGGRPDDLTFLKGSTVCVLKEQGEWLYGNLSAQQFKGWFPKSYVKIVIADSLVKEFVKPPETLNIRVKVLFDYQQRRDDEISINAGEYASVVEKTDENWWKVQNDFGKIGYVPASFLSEETAHDFKLIQKSESFNFKAQSLGPRKVLCN